MKKNFVLIVLLLTVLLSACGRPTDAECESAQIQMTGSKYVKLDGMEVNMILNNNFAPDTVGQVLKDCINSGWDYQ